MALPSGYSELTYIQSSGTQYIDTGFRPNYNTRVVIDCEPTETASAQRAIFGARNSTSGQASLAYGFNIMNSTSCRSDYMGSNATISGTFTSGTRMSVDMNKNVCTVNGQTGTNTAKTSGQTPYNLFLFNVNNVGTPHSSFGFKGKIYSCKIYDNGTLVRDFVPCKNASGTVGLYDVKNNDFYTNAGSGTFTQGDVVSGGGTSGGSCKVTVSGSGNSTNLYVQINNQKYYSATSLTVNANTTMTVYASSSRKIYVNGKQVTKSNSRYTYTIKGDIDVAFSNASSSTNGKVEITEKSSGGSGGGTGGSGGHKTLVNGTAYEITGGKVRVNGTVYEIAKGKTLVNGTAYEIAFGGGITFTVRYSDRGVTYGPFKADEGMTWSQFINSKYNENGLFHETGSDSVCYDDGSGELWLTYDGGLVQRSEVIVDGRVYEAS